MFRKFLVRLCTRIAACRPLFTPSKTSSHNRFQNEFAGIKFFITWIVRTFCLGLWIPSGCSPTFCSELLLLHVHLGAYLSTNQFQVPFFISSLIRLNCSFNFSIVAASWNSKQPSLTAMNLICIKLLRLVEKSLSTTADSCYFSSIASNSLCSHWVNIQQATLQTIHQVSLNVFSKVYPRFRFTMPAGHVYFVITYFIRQLYCVNNSFSSLTGYFCVGCKHGAYGYYAEAGWLIEFSGTYVLNVDAFWTRDLIFS